MGKNRENRKTFPNRFSFSDEGTRANVLLFCTLDAT